MDYLAMVETSKGTPLGLRYGLGAGVGRCPLLVHTANYTLDDSCEIL